MLPKSVLNSWENHLRTFRCKDSWAHPCLKLAVLFPLTYLNLSHREQTFIWTASVQDWRLPNSKLKIASLGKTVHVACLHGIIQSCIGSSSNSRQHSQQEIFIMAVFPPPHRAPFLLFPELFCHCLTFHWQAQQRVCELLSRFPSPC